MTTVRRRAALLVVVLVAASAWAGVARADDVQPDATTPFVVVAQPDGFSDGSDSTVSTAPTGFSDGSDVPTPTGFSDGADALAVDAPAAAIVAN
jgi:hypothetical protein